MYTKDNHFTHQICFHTTLMGGREEMAQSSYRIKSMKKKIKKEEKLLKQSKFAIFTALLTSHHPHIINNWNSFYYLRSLYKRMIAQVLAFLQPCDVEWWWISTGINILALVLSMIVQSLKTIHL